jgi:protein tyrosine phosphatase (PTP) superfamily phosphohydrolase (DUF442 family)
MAMDLTVSTSEVSLLPEAKPRRPARWLWRLALVALLVFFCHEVSRRLFGLNFHVVVSGCVYRGAQPTPRFIEQLVKEHGVRTIINLRGCGTPADWYVKETQAVQQLGVNQEDVCFSAVRLPSSQELRRLVEVLDGAEYPIYLHCRRGADRTGMAAVIVMLLGEGRSAGASTTLAEARTQLGLWYGHVAVGETRVLDRFFDLYAEWLDEQGRAHDSATFRHWLLEEYKGGWCSARFEEFAPLAAEARKGEPLGYRVRVRNTGTKEWRMRVGSLAGVHLAYQVWDKGSLLAEGRAGLFDRTVAPGETVSATLVVRPVPRAGRFRLLVDMAEERHCWFYQAGSEPHEEELVVVE